jgi:hypothetical protein
VASGAAAAYFFRTVVVIDLVLIYANTSIRVVMIKIRDIYNLNFSEVVVIGPTF